MVFGRTSDEISAATDLSSVYESRALGSNIAEKKRVQALVWRSHTLSVATPDYPSVRDSAI